MTSNKFLQEQYLRDIERFQLDEIKMLQGQANYVCNIDPSVNFPKAICSSESVSKLMKDGCSGKYKCFVQCDYLTARKNAIDATSTVFNYAYFLSTMNFVTNLLGSNAPFPVRQLTIFDECHVLPQIVSDAFSLEFNPAKYIREVRNASIIVMNTKGRKDLFDKYHHFETWRRFAGIIETLPTTEDFKEVETLLTDLKEVMLLILSDFNIYISSSLEKKANDEDLSDFDKFMIAFATDITTPYGNLGKQIDVYTKIGFDTAVISSEKLDKTKNKYLSEEPESRFSESIDMKLKFECTNESEMVKRYALSFTKYSVLMSATIGKPEEFAQRLRLEKDTYSCFEVESDFNFEQSPIYMVRPMISMSYTNKVTNMPRMMQRIKDIINHNVGVRGLIHTGNFEVMKEIEKLRHPRILTYSNSAEKSEIIRLLQTRDDAIVVGPSLIEGIDLKDDLCRFMIFVKVPYLSLASKLNKRKLELYKDWYNFMTLVSFQQGLGRSVRHKEDWCKTYLLDASFDSFFARYDMPKIIKTRLQDTSIDNLDLKLPSADDEWEEMMKKLQS